MSKVLYLDAHKSKPQWARAHERAKLKLPLLAGVIQDRKLNIPVRIRLFRDKLTVRIPSDQDYLIAHDTLKIMGGINGLDIKMDYIPMWQAIFMEYRVIYESSI